MSVKSTVELTYKQAEEKYIELYTNRKISKLQAKARRKLTRLTAVQIEDKLEAWNDEAHNGEGFENYIITDKHNYEG